MGRGARAMSTAGNELNELHDGVVQIITDADLRIRAAAAGRPVDEAARIAADEFGAIGVVLRDDDLRDYALSVIEERPHKFNINM